MDSAVGLPPGFVLDEPAGLPPGFVLDNPSVTEDVIKSVPGGLAKLTSGLAGLGGDARSLVAAGASAASKLLPEGHQASSEGVSNVLRHVPGLGGPTSDQAQKAIEGITGKLYEPQTFGGRLIQTGLEFAPAIIGGPEAIASKALTRVAIPALAAEGVGEITDNPYAKAGAAIGASALAHRAVTPRAPATMIGADELQQAVDAKYAAAHATGLELRAQPLRSLQTQMETSLVFEGVTRRNAPQVFDAIEHHVGSMTPGATMGTRELENFRKELVAASRNQSDGDIRRGGGIAIRDLENYLSNIPASHVATGNVVVARNLFREARADFRALQRTRIIEGKEELGTLNAQSAHAGQNKDNSMRQALKQLVRPGPKGVSPAQREGFNQAEIAAVRGVVTGPGLQSLRFLGKLAPTNAVNIGAHILTHGATGGMTLPAIPVSMAAKKIADATTLGRTQRAIDLVASRSPEGQRYLALQARNPLPRQLSAKQAGLLTAILAARQPGILPLDRN